MCTHSEKGMTFQMLRNSCLLPFNCPCSESSAADFTFGNHTKPKRPRGQKDKDIICQTLSQCFGFCIYFFGNVSRDVCFGESYLPSRAQCPPRLSVCVSLFFSFSPLPSLPEFFSHYPSPLSLRGCLPPVIILVWSIKSLQD